jgi:hypothetical protein
MRFVLHAPVIFCQVCQLQQSIILTRPPPVPVEMKEQLLTPRQARIPDQYHIEHL